MDSIELDEKGHWIPMAVAPSIEALIIKKHVFNGHVRSMRAGAQRMSRACLAS